MNDFFKEMAESEKEAKRQWLEAIGDMSEFSPEEIDALWEDAKKEVNANYFRQRSRVPKTSKEKRKRLKIERKKHRKR